MSGVSGQQILAVVRPGMMYSPAVRAGISGPTPVDGRRGACSVTGGRAVNE